MRTRSLRNKRGCADLIYAAVSCIRVPTRWALLKGLFLISPKRLLDGVEVVDVAGEEPDQTLHRLHEALEVINRADPRRYGRLRHDFRRIALMKAGRPQFASEIRTCLIRSGYVRQNSAEAVATTLVHEAAHARLHRLGVGYGPRLRGRVEEACVKEQIAFAELLGNSEVLSQLAMTLEGSLGDPIHRYDDNIAALRHLGVPEWLLQLWPRRLPPAADKRDR